MPTPRKPAPIRKRRDRYHHGDLERALVTAALRLIAKRGPHGFTMREAARAAGVSSGAPYRHFRDRAALLAKVAETGFLELRAALGRARAGAGGSPVAELWAMGIEHVRFATSRPHHYRVMFGPDGIEKPAHPALHRAAQDTFDLLVDTVRRCQQSGMVRGGDPVEIAIAAFSLMHGLADVVHTRQLVGMRYPEERAPELPARVGVLLFEGLAPRLER